MATAKKLPSGSWRCRVLIRTENVLQPDGTYQKKKIYKSFTSKNQTRKGKAEAERMASEYLLTHKDDTTASMSLRQAMEATLEIKRNTLSPATVRTYQSLIRTAYPSIIDYNIEKIKSADIQRCMNDLAVRTTPKHVKNAYGFFTSVMSVYMPDAKYTVKLPQKQKPQTHTPTDAEVKEVIEYLERKDPELLKAVYLAAFGTLRRSEICAVTADDLKGNILHIHGAMVLNDENDFVMKTTKTEESTRFVYLPDFVVDAMPKEGQLVNLKPSQVTNRFIKVFNNCNVQKFRFHDLRHYSASIMHALGVPDQYIMQQGGWRSDGVLKRVYRNAMDDYQKLFMDKTTGHFAANFGKDATKDDTK